MKLFFSVGEPSGDLHGANLIRQLRALAPECQCVGYGGPRMQAAGCTLHYDLTQLAVMWLLRVVLNLHRFVALLVQADRYFRDQRPDAVILIDYPGFNWWIARRAKARGIPVFYYGTPQLWAWAAWRVKKMRRYVDHVLCKLPFEVSWYQQRGCNATFVGHPYFDQMAAQEYDSQFLAESLRDGRRVVTLLPGSRTQEVKLNLPWLLRAASHVLQEFPDTRVVVASFNSAQAEMAQSQVAASGLPVEVHVGRTPELIRLAECCLACSGSVSLELLYHEKPTVVVYWISRTAMRIQRFFRKSRYITLVNLLATSQLEVRDGETYDPDRPDAERVPFPEYLTSEDKSASMARWVSEWLRDETSRQARVAQLRELKARYAQPGASKRAASYILAALKQSRGQRSCA